MTGFVLHPDAYTDLDEIWEYIAADNQDAAESDGGLNVFGPQAGKIGKNFLGGVAGGQAGKHRANRDAGPSKDGLSSTRFRVSNGVCFVAFLVAALVSHSAPPALAGLIVSCG